jgi:hypothetical protein
VPKELPSLKDIAEAAGYGVVLPAAVAAILLLACVLMSRRAGALRAAGAIAFLVAFLTGYAVLCRIWFNKPILQFKDEWQWLPMWVTVAVIVDCLDLLAPKKPILNLVLCLVWFVAVLTVVFVAADYLVPKFAARTPGDVPMEEARPKLLLAIRATMFILWAALGSAAERLRGPLFPVLLACVALTCGMILEAGGSGTYAQLAGLLGGVLLGYTPLLWWIPNTRMARGTVPGLAIVLSTLMLNGYSDSFVAIPAASYMAATLAPLGLLIGANLPVRLPKVWKVIALTLGVLLPLGAAVALMQNIPK